MLIYYLQTCHGNHELVRQAIVTKRKCYFCEGGTLIPDRAIYN